MNIQIETTMQALRKIQEALNTLSGGPAEYYFKQMEGYGNTLFERFCPYKIGDRVKLCRALEGDLGAWKPCVDLWLKPGALGIVKERDCFDGKFCFSVEFDDESWKDWQGIIHKTAEKDRHVYTLGEKYLTGV